jgi:hypothetical protein
MNDKTNDIIYTAQDIEHYLSGKLTPLQMHLMEKAALDDPFLAEAMEGYAAMNEKQWKYQLAGLKNRFENKEGAKIIPLGKRKNNWWKVAAAVVLMGGISVIAYMMINKREPVQIAGNVPAAKQPPADSNASIAKQPPTAETTVVTPGVKPTAPEKNNTTFLSAGGNSTAVKETKVSDSLFVYTPSRQKAGIEAKENAGSVRTDDDVLKNLANNDTKPVTVAAPPVFNNSKLERKAEENKGYSNNANNGVVSYQYDKAKAASEKDQYTAALGKEAQLNRNFIAQVVGPDNSPLPFANISIKNENFGTYADAKGNFRLVSSDSILTVEVKAAGYQPKFYTLQSYAQQNKIMLAQDDEAFKYKAINGNSAAVKSRSSRRATLVKDSLVNVEPADGWDNYNTYVDNNLDIPEDMVNKNIHGRVELSFDVRSNGTITNIKVDKSLCDNCDEVAKRLIEQGPQWKVKKGKKAKGKVTVEF